MYQNSDPEETDPTSDAEVPAPESIDESSYANWIDENERAWMESEDFDDAMVELERNHAEREAEAEQRDDDREWERDRGAA